jgi:metal-responsive CopG/Arc/MetJ family transcriptional regulator
MAKETVKRTIRIPTGLSTELDCLMERSYYPSANQFIVEAVREKLLRERR